MVWNLIPVGKVTAGFPSPAVAAPPNESALPAKSTVVDRAPSEYHPVLSLGSSASSMAARLESKAFSRLMYSTCAAAEIFGAFQDFPCYFTSYSSPLSAHGGILCGQCC